MGTATQLVDLAKSQVGVAENPPNSNNVRYNTWYYGREVNGSSYPWCMVFCQWCFDQVKVALPIRTASCTALMNAAKEAGRWVTGNYQPGDLVIYTFNQNGTPSHCGIYLKKESTFTFSAVEGNTSLSNNANGGEVMIRTRSLSATLGAYRPIFTKEEDMDISNLTDAQCYEILTKAMRHAATLPQPDWAKKEGYWDKAVEKGIITSNTPRNLLTRDEFITILGRIWPL